MPFSIVQPAAPRPFLDIRVTTEKEYQIPGQVLKIVSPSAGATYKGSVSIIKPSRLVGVTFFIDSPDTGDYVNAFLNGRTIIDSLQIGMVSNTSYPVSLSEDAPPGSILEIAYFSKGTTAKTLTWTPKAVLL